MNSNVKYASFFERLISKLIDTSIYIALVIMPFIKIVQAAEYTLLLNYMLDFILFAFFISILTLPFEVLMISRFGGTPGKLLIGIRIQKENGVLLNLKESFFRLTLGKAVSGLFFSLGYLWIFMDQKKQAWHDKVAGTVVVRR